MSSGPGASVAAGDRVGRFVIGEPLGEGGMARVFKAAGADDQPVAIKLLKPELAMDETFKRRFVHEARSAGQVRHKHLVPLLEVGEHDGVPMLVMPFYPGGALADAVDRGPLSTALAVRYLTQLASGIDALHAASIIHRDLKPANVLIDANDDAHVSDFGLAKGPNYTALTTAGQKLGTFDYMAPELIRGSPATPASDIYALGCVTYEMLAGTSPFGKRPMFQVAVAHLQEEPRPLNEIRDDVAADLNWAVQLALAKEAADRPPTATAYANMVRVAANGGSRASVS